MSRSRPEHPAVAGAASAPTARLLALAERDPRRAALFARAWHAAAPDQPARQLALGWALMRWERTAEAAALLEAAEAAHASRGDHALARLCRYGLLLARQVSGEGAHLQAEWQALAAAHEAAGEHASAARARCEQVAHLNLIGKPAQARELAATIATAVAAHGTSQDRARHSHVAGAAAADCGLMDEAAALLDAAAAGFAVLRLPVYVARVQFEQAALLNRQEQFHAARPLFERAAARFRRADLPLRIALAERDLGMTAARTGNLAAAIALSAAARARFLTLGRATLAASCDLNLGAIAHYSGLADLAQAAYASAGAAYERAGNRRMALITQRNQAMLLIERGRPHAALALLARVHAGMSELGDRLEAAEALAVRAHALARLGDAAAAHATLEDAHERFAALGNQAAAAECLLDQAWLHLRHGETALAATCFAAARPHLVGRPNHLWRLGYGEGLLAEAAGDSDSALACYEDAGSNVAQLRHGLASEHASSALFQQAGELFAAAFRLAAQHGDATRLLILKEQQRAQALQRQIASAPARSTASLVELEAQRAALRDALDDAEPSAGRDAVLLGYLAVLLRARHPAGAPPPPEPFALPRLRATLGAAYGDDWTLLVPIHRGDELAIITLTPGQLHLDRLPIDADLADALDRACRGVSRLHTYRDLAALRAGEAPTYPPLRALGAWLLPPPALARLHPDHRLLIVPDGPLHALPWAALSLDGQWLIERAIVELLPSLTAVRACATPSAASTPALLVGCAEFGERAAPLPRALETLDLVAERWPGPVERLVGAEATRPAILERAERGELRRFGLIQVASHAHFGSHGLLAHIKLADDDLLADDLLRLGLDDSIVVLAACSGAAAEVLPGDEVLSLSRALLAAGARSVLTGLWQVYDAGVLRAMATFTTTLAAGADPARALALAQREMISDATPMPEASVLRSPYVWASFCVTSVGLALL